MSTSSDERGELALDLFWNPQWSMFFERPEQDKVRDVAAYTHVSNGAEEGQGPGERARRRLTQILSRAMSRHELALQALVVHATLQPKAATVRYRKLWKSVPWRSPQDVRTGPEVELECDQGLRFAALMTVPISEVGWLVTVMGAFNLVIPVLVSSPAALDEMSTREMAGVALPPHGCARWSTVDWPGAAAWAVKRDAVIFGATSDTESREVVTRMFGSKRQVMSVIESIDDESS